MKTKYYEGISNLNFIESKTLNSTIGIKYFKWIVKNTFFKFLNQKLKVGNGIVDLTEIRREMTIAKAGYLIGFIFVVIADIYKGITHNNFFASTIIGVNILLNLHPSLFQQENKRRIDKLIKGQVNSTANNV